MCDPNAPQPECDILCASLRVCECHENRLRHWWLVIFPTRGENEKENKLSDSTLFPTMVVGSLPRDRWVHDVVEDRNLGRIGVEQVNRLLNGAVVNAIRMQEQTGLDFVSDGELRRNSYLRVFTDAVDGFKLDVIPPSRFSTAPLPAIVSRLVQKRPLTTSEATFLKSKAHVRTIATLPSPYTIGGKMWSEKHSKSAYCSPEEAMEACIPIINKEVKTLANMGIDIIQLDEPWLGDVPNPTYRNSEGITNIEHELDLYVRSVNGAVDGIDGASLSVHVCGHTSPTSPENNTWAYDLLFEALSRMNVDRFTMAFSGPNTEGFKWLRYFPSDKMLGLGVVETNKAKIEPTKEIVERTERAMEFVSKDRITLNPDCGFSPSRRNHRTLDEVYLRLRAMCHAAEILRDKHG